MPRQYASKARRIFEGMDLEDQRALTYFAGKNHQTSLEFLEERLKEIGAKQRYCEEEGLNYYKDFFWPNFLKNVDVIKAKLSNIMS